MLLTVVNQLAVPLTVDFPVGVTLEASGGADTYGPHGVSMRDLMHGEDQGHPAWKRLDLHRQKGELTVAIIVDGDDANILDVANEL